MKKTTTTYIEGPRSSHPPRDPKIEAARFLASAARRFVRATANESDVEKAIEAWREVTGDKK